MEAGISQAPYSPNWSIIRAFSQWNYLSWSIPRSAIIDQLKLSTTYLIYSDRGSRDTLTFQIYETLIKPYSSEPLSNRWVDLGDGISYNGTTAGNGTGTFTLDLGSSAIERFTAQLRDRDKDWFGIGYIFGDDENQGDIRHYISLSSPALEVNYTLEDITPPTITINFNPGTIQACDKRLVSVSASESNWPADRVDYISLYLSTDDGQTWEWQMDTLNISPYKNPFPEGGKIKWNVPETPATWCRLKAVAFDLAGNAAEVITPYSFRIEAAFDPSPWEFVNNGLQNPDIQDISVCKNYPNVVFTVSPVSRSSNYGETWTRLPFPGQGYPWGQSVAVAVHPIDSNIVYVGLHGMGDLVDVEGVWKSTDGGQHWFSPPPFYGERHGILNIAFAPSDFSKMYAVGCTFLGPPGYSTEVYKSTNWGQNWEVKENGLPPRAIVYCVAVDPNSPNVAYLGLGPGIVSPDWFWVAGIWKTTDGGDHWVQKLGSQSNNRYPSIMSIVIDPQNPNTIFAGVGWDSRQTQINGVFKTINGGDSWFRVGESAISSFVSSIALDPSNRNKIYLGTWFSESRVYFSSDGGSAWVNTTGCEDLSNDVNVVTPSPVYNNPDPNKPCLLSSGLDVAGIFRYLPDVLQAPPPAPTGLVAQAVTESSIELRWNYEPSFKTAYAIYRSTVSGIYGNPVALLPPSATSWTDNGLNRGRRYFYVIKAVRLNLYSDASTEASSETFWLNTPINLDATALSYNEVYLSFGDVCLYEDGYNIQRRLFNQGNFVTVGNVSNPYPTGWVHYTDANNLAPSTKYEYRVFGVDEFGHQSNFSIIDTVTTRGYLSSTQAVATGNNNGRKIVRDDVGRLHMVYSDGAYTNYAYSSDNGYTWSTPEYWMYPVYNSSPFLPALAVERGSNPKVYVAYIGWWKTPTLPELKVMVRNPGIPNGERWQEVFHDSRYVRPLYNRLWGPPSIMLDFQNRPHVVWQYWNDDPNYQNEVGLWHWWQGQTAPVKIQAGSDGKNPSISMESGDTLHLAFEGRDWGGNQGIWTSYFAPPNYQYCIGFANDGWNGVHPSEIQLGNNTTRCVWEAQTPSRGIFSSDLFHPNVEWSYPPSLVSTTTSPTENYPFVVGNYCVWADNISNNWEVYYSQKVGDSWSPRVNVSQSPSVLSKYPHAVFYQYGRPIFNKYLGVVWTEGNGPPNPYQIKYQSVRLPWDVAYSTSKEATGYNNAKRFLADGQGNLYLTYTSKDSVFYISTTDGGDNWSTPLALGLGYSPALNLDLNGNPCATWRSMEGDSLHLYFARRTQNSWSVSKIYSEKPPFIAYISPPSVTIDRTDTAHVIFEYALVGPVGAWKVYYGNFAVNSPRHMPLTILDSLGMAPDSLPVSPSLCLDGRGVVHAVWSDLEGEVQYRKGGQGLWSSKVNLSNSPTASYHPTINAFGPVAVAWQEEVSPGMPDVFYRTIGDNLFSPIQNLSNSPQVPSEAPIISGSRILWTEVVNGDKEIYQTQFNSETMSWSTPGSASTSEANSQYPQAALSQNDQSSWAYTVWTEEIVPDQAYQILFSGQELPGQPSYALDLGQNQPSPFLVQRDGYIQFGPEPAKTVDYDTTELVYHLTNLNPYKKAKLLLSFYHESHDNWKFKLEADHVSLGMVHVPSGQEVVFEKWLPPCVFDDGEVTLRIKRERGDFVVLGKLLVYEYAQGRGGGGPQSAEGAIPIPLPTVFGLAQSYPNPMNDNATIRYQLPVETQVTLKVYNVTGQLVRDLVRDKQKPGYYITNWKGEDFQGHKVSSGVYFYRLEAGNFVKTRKLVVVR